MVGGPDCSACRSTAVHDVFIASAMTPVPLAPPEIVGLLNLRGRVVTAMCLRRRLGLPDRDERQARDGGRRRASRAKSYGLLVDEIGEVHEARRPTSREPNPVNLDRALGRGSRAASIASTGGLLVILDIDARRSALARRAPAPPEHHYQECVR